MSRPEDNVAATLALLRSHSLTSVVQKEIERMIVSGELRAGERINENLLASRLSVSRGPIREACRGLEQAGLVTAIVNRGVFVRQVSLKEALDVYDIRASLFALAGKTLAPRITGSQVGVLSALVDRMESLAGSDDVDAYYPLNIEFHARIVEFCGNEQLAALYDGLVKQLHLFRRRGLVTSLKTSSREHREILRALSAGDPERAGRVMEQHVLAGKGRLLAILGETDPRTANSGSTHEN